MHHNICILLTGSITTDYYLCVKFSLMTSCTRWSWLCTTSSSWIGKMACEAILFFLDISASILVDARLYYEFPWCIWGEIDCVTLVSLFLENIHSYCSGLLSRPFFSCCLYRLSDYVQQNARDARSHCHYKLDVVCCRIRTRNTTAFEKSCSVNQAWLKLIAWSGHRRLSTAKL